MEQTANVVKIRPAEMELAQPSFQPSVQSCPSNLYIQEIQAQSYSADRFSFSWRSPSQNLLCSPYVEGVFQVQIKTPYALSKNQGIGCLVGSFSDDTKHVALGADANDAYTTARGVGYRQLMCLGSSNAVMNSCESTSITINGATWSTLNQNLYQRSLDKCFVPDEVQQKVWSMCGGQPDAHDSVPVSGHVLGIPASAEALAAAAFGGAQRRVIACTEAAGGNTASHGFIPTESSTMDSGVVRRMNNFYDQIVEEEKAGAADTTYTYKLEVKFPLDGFLLNGCWGQSGLSRSDPRLRMALGLPHINQGTITLQFKDLMKNLIRRLGRPGNFAAATTRLTQRSIRGKDMEITLASYIPRLRFTYIRLPSFRSYPQTAALQIYRREVRRPQGTRSAGDFGSHVYPYGLFGKAHAAAGGEKGLKYASGLAGAAAITTAIQGSAGAGAKKNGRERGVPQFQRSNHTLVIGISLKTKQ